MSKRSVNPPAEPRTVEASESIELGAPFRACHVGQPTLGELTGDDLVISGWVVAEGQPVERVVVTADGRRLARVRPDRPRPDIAEAFPALETAEKSGFRILLPAGAVQEARELVIGAAVGDEPLQPIWTIRLGYGDAAPQDSPKRAKGRRRWTRRKKGDAEPVREIPAEDDFRVIAIISSFNEADIIAPVLEHLAENGIHSYLIDNESTDDTVQLAREWLGRGLLGIESISSAPEGGTSWKSILARKVELAQELGADWYIHHDADEIREGPWPEMSLCDAIRHVDRLGYNAIDFRVLNFRPVDDAFRPGDDPRDHFRLWEEAAEYDRLQRKCWKAGVSDLALEDGGHDVRFAERRLFPLRFLMRHYPIRGQAHGTKKVLRERQGRFVTAEVEMGWHRQYAHITGVDYSFLKNPASLRPFDLDQVRVETALEDGRSIHPPTQDADPEAAGVRGVLDQVTPTTISGWAARDGAADGPLLVEVWDGANVVAEVVADEARADLEKAGVPGGRAGFTLRTPNALLDGRAHWIWATAAGTSLGRSPTVLSASARAATVS